LTGKDEFWPPSGHIAGVYARTDQQRGVHKAPANTNIRGALGVERRLTDEEQGPLNLMGINVIRVFPGQSQPVVWGARTTAGDLDRNWQYVNIRRLFLFLEESIQEGIRWAVFEPNNLLLWQKLKRTITEFLTRVWRDGALFGETADQAFYVRIDEVLNPDSSRALGRLYIEIGVRPAYPAEFIIVRIGIWQGGTEVSEG
jgi:phage tail sheath protein FI